jgi:hypothetical protein
MFYVVDLLLFFEYLNVTPYIVNYKLFWLYFFFLLYIHLNMRYVYVYIEKLKLLII